MIRLEVFTKHDDGSNIECVTAIMSENSNNNFDKVALFHSMNLNDGPDSFKPIANNMTYEGYKDEFIRLIKSGYNYRFYFDLNEQTILGNMCAQIMAIVNK